MEGQLAGGRRGVDRFVQGAQADLVLVEVADPGNEVLELPAEPVKSPNDERVASTEDVLELHEARTGGGRTGHPVDDYPFTARGLKSVVLQIEVLVMCGHPRVSDQHGRRRSHRRNLVDG